MTQTGILEMLTVHEGVVMCSTDKTLPQNNNSNKPPGDTAMPYDEPSANEDDGQPEEIRMIEENTSFDEIMAWGHEAFPDASTDPYVKGIEEWIAFAEQVD